MKEILWVDADHIWIWGPIIAHLREERLFQVECLTTLDTAKILSGCKGKRAVVIHCGTVRPMAELREILLAIERYYPKIKIVLETNCTHPAVSGSVDYYILKPPRLEDIVEILNKACG